MDRIRENILVANGNYSLYTEGEDVYASDGTLNVLPGQIVIYDPRTLKALGPGATVATNNRIVIGVGIDTNGDGVADELRKVFGDQLFGHHLNAATAEPPRYGTAQIVDILFSCPKVGETYSIDITVEDNQSDNEYPFNRTASYVFSATTDQAKCDDCNPTATTDEIACKLVDAINNNVGKTDARYQSVFVKLAQRQPEFPFHAFRLFPNTYRYCIETVAGSCDNCIQVPVIEEIFFDGGAVALTNTKDPNDDTKTLIGQLDRVISQINTALDGKGSAVLTRGTGPCADYQIEVNTCYDDFELRGDDSVAFTPCDTTDPFAAITVPNACKDCEAVDPTLTYTSGIRLVAKPVDLNCSNCFPPNPPLGYYGRLLNIYPVGGFLTGTTYVRTVQNNSLPEGDGYTWQWREYKQSNGGSGRNYNNWTDSHYGPLQLPLSTSRALASGTAVCSKMYCAYALEHSLETTKSTHGRMQFPRGRSIVLIPSADTVTIAEFEAVINPYIASTPHISLSSLACGSDQDQDENTPYPDYNGMLI